MSRNGSGVYTLPAGNPVVTGTTITSSWANSTMQNIADALTQSVASDGQTPMSGALNMATSKIINVGTPTLSTDAVTKAYADALIGAGGVGVFSSLTDTGLTATRVTYATTGGLLTDSANMTFNGTTLTAGGLTTTGATSTGTLSASGVATFSAGTVSLPAITTTGDTNTGIYFPAADTIAFTEGGTESMRIDSSGQVGIGTSSPSSPLDVVGWAQVVTSAAAGVGIRIKSPAGSATPAIIQFTDNPVTAQWATITSPSINVLTFGTSSEAMRIDSSGNLLVGTTSVFVNGKTNISFDQAGASGLAIKNTSATATGFLVAFYNSSNALQGSINQVSSTITAYNTTSDYRLKNNVLPIQNALDTVKALNPISFIWDDGRKDDGFLAHELQAVIPNCVTGEKDAINEDGTPKYQQMDNSGVIPFLVKAIQEQQVMIETLTTRLTTLENK